jgi:outer membrane scaffolding protein for murein synthesis (MipA/OmpV family)
MSLFFVAALAATVVGCSGEGPCERAAGGSEMSQPVASADVSFGPGLLVVPRYPGSSVERVWPFPAMNLHYGHLFATTDQGIGMYAVNEGPWRVGVSLAPHFGRHHHDGPRVSQLAEIGTAAAVKMSAGYGLGPFTLSAAVARDVGGSNGLTFDTGLAWRWQLSPRVTASLGANATAGNRRDLQTWFGVTQTEAARSGLAQYSVKAGIQSAGPSLLVNYALNATWSLQAFLSDQRLLHQAANSPVVERRRLPTIFLGAARHFGPRRG